MCPRFRSLSDAGVIDSLLPVTGVRPRPCGYKQALRVYMRISRMAVLSLFIAASVSKVVTQNAPQSTPAQPAFDVVSIKLSREASRPSISERPDGGLILTNYPLAALIARAYPPAIPLDMIGLPSWTLSEKYDVKTTSTIPSPTAEERKAMLRAMLADRFKLVVHFEERDQPAFDLVLAHRDGKLGPGLKRSEVECVPPAKPAANEGRGAEAASPMPARLQPNGSAPMCRVQMAGPRMEGDVTMAALASLLRQASGRYVVDKTGLAGSYHITMEFDRAAMNAGQDPQQAPPDAPPSVFTAVQEQLGLRLVSSRAKRETLVIDRVERPTEN